MSTVPLRVCTKLQNVSTQQVKEKTKVSYNLKEKCPISHDLYAYGTEYAAGEMTKNMVAARKASAKATCEEAEDGVKTNNRQNTVTMTDECTDASDARAIISRPCA